ncbi:MAG TPA: DUF1464 family protein [Gemmatimonadales bacterium]|nr:DUF1464 family protein [Gemmatimonadales bacterium]
MPRVAGIDPGTLSLDVCGLDDGRLFLDATWPTAEILANPRPLLDRLLAAGAVDLVVGPSGYGLPLRPARDVSDDELRLAFLAGPGERGGIGGLRSLARHLEGAGLPVVFMPGVIHLDTVPRHRKLNRVDLGTADKLCVAALAIGDQARRRRRQPDETSLVLLELGGAFTGGVAVADGQLVDGVGGTSGPLGWRAAGALDAEVAYLAGEVTKAAIFQGGVTTVVEHDVALAPVALEAYVESAARAARQLLSATPRADEIVLSGRMAADPTVREAIAPALATMAQVRMLTGFAAHARQGAQGAALIADGLMGGKQRAMVERLRIKEASGTVLDHLYVITPAEARRRLGLADV